ncbi:MAG: ABC transporter permease [Clostridiales bacterium]|nr:ABC transporter permease [Clostridiales bacterium]
MKTNPLKKVSQKIKNFRLTRGVFAWPYVLFLTVFVVLPLVIILVNAFLADGKLSFANFIALAKDGASIKVLINSIFIGAVTTILCLAIGYPVAYTLANMKTGSIIVILFLLPMWVNFLVRTLAARAVFEALSIPLGEGTVLFGMVYNYIPFMILPLHTTLTNIDKSFGEAAADLGADRVTVFLKVTLPLSVPGIISGIIMVFIPTISTFAISQLLGGVHLFGDSIHEKFIHGLYGVGSVMSLIMLAFVLLSNMLLKKFNKGEAKASIW